MLYFSMFSCCIPKRVVNYCTVKRNLYYIIAFCCTKYAYFHQLIVSCCSSPIQTYIENVYDKYTLKDNRNPQFLKPNFEVIHSQEIRQFDQFQFSYLYTSLSAEHESPLHNVLWDLRSDACNKQDLVRVCRIKNNFFG